MRETGRKDNVMHVFIGLKMESFLLLTFSHARLSNIKKNEKKEHFVDAARISLGSHHHFNTIKNFFNLPKFKYFL